jgi:hypothetical protein
VKCLGSSGVVVALQLAWHPSSKLLQRALHCFNPTFSQLCCLHQIWASRTFRKHRVMRVLPTGPARHAGGTLMLVWEGLCAIDLQRWDKVLES